MIFTKSTYAFLREHENEVENCLKLKNMSKGRKAMRRSLEAALDNVTQSGYKDAKLKVSTLLNDIMNIVFVCGLMFLKNIMSQTM